MWDLGGVSPVSKTKITDTFYLPCARFAHNSTILFAIADKWMRMFVFFFHSHVYRSDIYMNRSNREIDANYRFVN